MSNSEARALPYFTDTFGRPLEAGKIYIGQAGLDPIANPQNVYSDAANTVVLQQPIRTLHGHATSAGQYVHLFCTTPYSITIMDASGRVNYTSLNESDPTATNIGKTVPQSSASLADLRARSGDSTNQVFVTGYGMYYYDASDTTSPESIPRVIVASDGSRYKLTPEYVVGGWLQASVAGSPTVAGAHLSYNDNNDGIGYLSVNKGSGAGGVILRVMSADGSTVLGSVAINAAGGITAGSAIVATAFLQSIAGSVVLNAAGNRSLYFDGTNYNMPGSELYVNSSQVMSINRFIAINETVSVGALQLGGSTPPTTGSWYTLGQANGVYLYMRVA